MLSVAPHIELPEADGTMIYDRLRRQWFRVGSREIAVLRAITSPQREQALAALPTPPEFAEKVIRTAQSAGIVVLENASGTTAVPRASRWGRSGLLFKSRSGTPTSSSPPWYAWHLGR